MSANPPERSADGPGTWARRVATARRVVGRALPEAGLDVRRLARSLRSARGFVDDYRHFRGMARVEGQPMPSVADLYPVLADRNDESGAARGHYFHQDLWAARKLFAARPGHHYDVGSRIDGFISSLVVYQPVTVIDVRPLDVNIENLDFVQADATDMGFLADRSVESISSLHAIEHFGLGRYGDPIDPLGWRKGVAELVRVCAPGGRVYFSSPIGRERLMFNAHRIFDPATLLDAFSELDLVSFDAVDDGGSFVPGADLKGFGDATYSCGLFVFTRPG